MQQKTNGTEKSKLKSLEEIFPRDQIVTHDCGSMTFLDWGIQILETAAQLPGKRLNGLSTPVSVKICTNCHKAVVHYAGDLYDATEFVDQSAIEQVIQTAYSKVPVKAGA